MVSSSAEMHDPAEFFEDPGVKRTDQFFIHISGEIHDSIVSEDRRTAVEEAPFDRMAPVEIREGCLPFTEEADVQVRQIGEDCENVIRIVKNVIVDI